MIKVNKMGDTKILAGKMIDLLAEVESYQQQKEQFTAHLKDLFSKYQAGQYTYFQYTKEKEKILKDKSKGETVNSYNAYIYSLLKKVEKLNEQLFFGLYNDVSYKNIAPAARTVVKFPEIVRVEQPRPKQEVKKELKAKVAEGFDSAKEVPVKIPALKPSHDRKKVVDRIKGVEKEKVKLSSALKISKEEKKRLATETVKKVVIPEPVVEAPSRVKIGDLLDKKPIEKKKVVLQKPTVKDKLKKIFSLKKKETMPVKAEERKVVESIKKKKEQETPISARKLAGKGKHARPEAPKKNWFDRYVEKTKPGPLSKYRKPAAGKPGKAPSKDEEEGVSFRGFFGWDLIKIIRERSRPADAIGAKTEIGESTVRLETRRRRAAAQPELKEQIEKITATALTEEAKRIKGILDKSQALRIYKPTFFGAVANITTKRVSLFLLKQFPDFFKDLYLALRLANIKVLSNTYVNMMVFSAMASMVFAVIIFGIVFSFMELPFQVVLVRTLVMTLVSGVLSFIVFYAYPFSKAKSRRLAINTNLPFAINHMAAVASSGVPPTKMFQLISESAEYGEIAVEAEKIVNYIEIFGYDVLTAIRSVALTTPSPQFKEFFNGMVSTSQSGGDVKNFLSQKAEEAMITYKLERKKYTETIATYSDIYTGVLIAAPLFFVAALSLVSMLGGTVGGTDVNVIIVVGTYIVIPLLNVAFIAFLKFTQPDI